MTSLITAVHSDCLQSTPIMGYMQSRCPSCCVCEAEVSCLTSRWPHSFQQRCGFKKATRKPEPKKVEEELHSTHSESSEPAAHRRDSTPYWEQQAPPSPPRAFGRLVRPFLFTVGVGDVYLLVLEVTSSA